MPAGPRETGPWNSTSIFEPRRSSLVSWTVRIAEVADRLASRAFPPSLWRGVRGEGLAQWTLNGIGRYCRLIPKHQEVVAAERARLKIQQHLEVRQARVERFQMSRRGMQAAGQFIDEASDRQVHLNPACCWIRILDESGTGDRSNLSEQRLVLYGGR